LHAALSGWLAYNALPVFLLVRACAGKPDAAVLTQPSPLKFQSRCISLFPNCTGYAIGSIEGRVGIQYIDEPPPQPIGAPVQDPPVDTRNFCFKCHTRHARSVPTRIMRPVCQRPLTRFSEVLCAFCASGHRQNQDVYSVNALRFHPKHNTFVTAGGGQHAHHTGERGAHAGRMAGSLKNCDLRSFAVATVCLCVLLPASDGHFVYWNHVSKQRLKINEKRSNSLTCADWNADGSMLALGVSYDYARGAEGDDKTSSKPNNVTVHRVLDTGQQTHAHCGEDSMGMDRSNLITLPLCACHADIAPKPAAV